PGVARPVADLDQPRLCRAVLVDDVDELALRALEHRALRHGERVGTRRAAQDHAHELAGTQYALRIGQLGARLARAGAGRDAHIGTNELAGALVQRPVGVLEGHLELPALREHDAARLHLLRELRRLIVRNAEVDP